MITGPRGRIASLGADYSARTFALSLDSQRQFDDLTGTIFEGHHQPLRVWILCLYFMGLNVSNQQIAAELALNKDDVQTMTTQLRAGIVANKSQST